MIGPPPRQKVKALEAKIGITPPPPKERGTAKGKGWVEMEALKVQRSSWRKERKVEGVQNQSIDLCKVGGGDSPPGKVWNRGKVGARSGSSPRNIGSREKNGARDGKWGATHWQRGQNAMAATPEKASGWKHT